MCNVGGNVNWWSLLWNTLERSPHKSNKDTPYDPAIPLLGIYLEKINTLIWKYISTPVFIAAWFTTFKTGKQPAYPWMKWIKIWLYTMEYHSSIKNEIFLFVTTWTDLESTRLWNNSNRERLISYKLTSICKTKKKYYLTHRMREWIGCLPEAGVEDGKMEEAGQDTNSVIR